MNSFFDPDVKRAFLGKNNIEDKKHYVEALFSNVSSSYDLMNDLMSLGLHRLWKRYFVRKMGILPYMRCMDLAGGTGDIAKMISLHNPELLVVCDLTLDMIRLGRRRLWNHGLIDCRWVCGDAQQLPFESESFDLISMAYGLRNVTDIADALGEIYRVLKPGGSFYCLEFSDVMPSMKDIYDFYSFNMIPFLGRIVARNSDAYCYLVDSIRHFPNHRELCCLMDRAGFSQVSVDRLFMGVTAIHVGHKEI